jgi:hypothetical protein
MKEGPGALREENGKSGLDRRGGEEIGFAMLVSHHRPREESITIAD